MTKNNEFGKFIGRICYKVNYIILKAQILDLRLKNKFLGMILVKHNYLRNISN